MQPKLLIFIQNDPVYFPNPYSGSQYQIFATPSEFAGGSQYNQPQFSNQQLQQQQQTSEERKEAQQFNSFTPSVQSPNSPNTYYENKSPQSFGQQQVQEGQRQPAPQGSSQERIQSEDDQRPQKINLTRPNIPGYNPQRQPVNPQNGQRIPPANNNQHTRIPVNQNVNRYPTSSLESRPISFGQNAFNGNGANPNRQKVPTSIGLSQNLPSPVSQVPQSAVNFSPQNNYHRPSNENSNEQKFDSFKPISDFALELFKVIKFNNFINFIKNLLNLF